MDLAALLEQNRETILAKWFDLISRTYPPATSEFLTKQEDQFRNPVGHAIGQGIGPIYDQVVSAMDTDTIQRALDGIIRIRAVQEFTASEAVGFVFQLHYLLSEFDCLENVAMPMLISGKSRKEAVERSTELLEEVGLKDRISHRPEELSGGERQKVQVARALINEPKVVLADEPTGNLDRKSSDSLIKLMLRLNERRRMTFLLVTHDEGLAVFGVKYRLVSGKLEE